MKNTFINSYRKRKLQPPKVDFDEVHEGLLALLGAWMGWQSLPMIVLLSSAVGAVLGISMILIQGRDRHKPIPFGPYLAVAGVIALFFGQQINHCYLGLTGMA